MQSFRSSHGQRSLAGHYFTDASVYDAEATLLANGWQAVGPAQAFAHGATPFTANGLLLLAVREGKEAPLRVFHNICRHRGTVLCEEPCLERSRIVCPYHGWSYHLDGTLAAAPNMERDEQAGGDWGAADDYSLVEVQAAEWGSVLFVHLGDGDHANIDEFLQPLTPVVEAWNLQNLSVVASRSYNVTANWKLLFQNYSECYHCPTLHPPLNRLTPYRDSENLFDEGPILGGPMRLSDPEGSMTSTGKRCAPPLPGLTEEQTERVYYFTIFPNLFLSLHPDYVLVHRLRRDAVDRTRVDCWWLAAEGVDADAIQPAVEFWDTTNRQDWWVCEQMQRGVNSPAYVPGPYSDLESLVAAFDRHYLEWIVDSG